MTNLDAAIAQIPMLIEFAQKQLKLESNPEKIADLKWWIKHLEQQQQES